MLQQQTWKLGGGAGGAWRLQHLVILSSTHTCWTDARPSSNLPVICYYLPIAVERYHLPFTYLVMRRARLEVVVVMVVGNGGRPSRGGGDGRRGLVVLVFGNCGRPSTSGGVLVGR